jgi:hypothetical protein
MLPQLGQVIVDCKINLGIRVGLHLGSEDKTNTGYSIKHARNRDFTIISYRVDMA